MNTHPTVRITVKTGRIVQRGWTEGYGTIDGFPVAAPNFVIENEQEMSFEEWRKSCPKS